MTDSANGYVLPKVWTWEQPSGGRFANINRPIAGPTHDQDLPVGRHPLQLYSLATPNGVKVTVMLSVAGSATSTPTRPTRSNTRSVATEGPLREEWKIAARHL